eukprot:CAMPEP_0198309910 /NCGR_PEP_ID=MMETSP1450-20131203/2143_1 /TAXON_ID=753684 ORGANISM="Madagascaria erythrocladiodes, Strain CCMP3234" /NCGR_SAMPLE_ID=MMETSP1450 /ASSEMBLY_ACC=CAM_ASM_001115 /LENGTH=750 /DNA_ID=CAMNT_0044012693 /DNA_START=146 /DNA_END=2398 /DNA_ORIENTATION=-
MKNKPAAAGGWQVVASRGTRPQLRRGLEESRAERGVTRPEASAKDKEEQAAVGRVAEVALGRGAGGKREVKLVELVTEVKRSASKVCWDVVDSDDNHDFVLEKDIKFVIPGDPTQVANDIQGFVKRSQTYSAGHEKLKECWRSFGENEMLRIFEFSRRLFESQELEAVYAAHRVLEEDDVYFKRRKGRIEARDAKTVDALLCRAQSARDIEDRRARVIELMRKDVESGSKQSRSTSDPVVQECIRCLKDLARRGAQQQRDSTAWYKEATFLTAIDRDVLRYVLEELGYNPTPFGALSLLFRLGYDMVDFNVFLESSHLMPFVFGPEVEAEVKDILENEADDPDAGSRVDYRDIRSFAIDAPESQEIDDAIGILNQNGENRICVHIADPLRWLKPQMSIFREALRRGASAYLATGVIPMIPEALSQELFSLGSGKRSEYPAITVSFVVREDGHIDEIRVENSLVRITDILTYQEADALVADNSDPIVAAMNSIGRLRANFRDMRGAVSISLPEIEISVTREENGVFDFATAATDFESSPSRVFVSEMMIAACEAVGRYCIERNISVPYRGSELRAEPSDEVIDKVPQGVAQESLRLRRMMRSETKLDPMPHKSLGLDHYCQMTSPLRRATDLTAHLQLKTYWRGEASRTDRQLWSMVKTALAGAREMKFLESRTNLYWRLAYVVHRGLDRLYEGILLFPMRKNECNVFIVELGYRFAASRPGHYLPGDTVPCKFTQVDPLRMLTRLRILPN